VEVSQDGAFEERVELVIHELRQAGAGGHGLGDDGAPLDGARPKASLSPRCQAWSNTVIASTVSPGRGMGVGAFIAAPMR
jgi:hypothetical protein